MWNTRELRTIAKYNIDLEEAALAHLPVEQRIPEEKHRIYETPILDYGVYNPARVAFIWRSMDGKELKSQIELARW
jgi:hypothetical protein